jgi:transketolase C-terminal domain/subunit
MENTNDTPVENTTKSLVSQTGKWSQRSERDAALLSETQIALQLSENSEVVTILLAILHGITVNTTSGDVLELGISHAKSITDAAGISEEKFREVVAKFAQFSIKARSWNPLAF